MFFAKSGLQHFKQAISDNLESLTVWTALMVLTFSHPAGGQTWTQTSAPAKEWRAVGCSAEGRVMVAAGDYMAAVYITTNYGATWISNHFAGPVGVDYAMASSADGTRLAAAGGGALVTSTNMGGSWELNSPGGSYNYGCLACSADGSELALVSGYGQAIYFSTNFGGTWSSNYPAVSNLTAVSLSADGRTVVAPASNGAVFMSTNQGRDWMIRGALSLNGINIRCIAASADCVRLAAVNLGSIYTSTNAGVTWSTSALSSGGSHWISVASSADGLSFAVANLFGQIYTSTDSGVNWSSNNAPHQGWISVASSADGRRLVAAANPGGVWTSYSPAAPVLDITSAATTAKISWLIPSADFALEEISDLSSTNWSTVGAAPNLNTTNLHYEVIVPVSGSNAFYRLRMR
jgi:photosystem II stability/assembly factor-like uncharacterized protein